MCRLTTGRPGHKKAPVKEQTPIHDQLPPSESICPGFRIMRLGGALVDLACDLLDRSLSLREQVDDLGAPTAAERMRHGGHRIEQRRLRRAPRHIINLTLEYLKSRAAGFCGSVRVNADAGRTASSHDRAVKTLVVLNDPAYGTERSYNGLRLAYALAKRDGEQEAS